MIRRRFLALAPGCLAAGPAIARAGGVDPRFPAAISARIGGKPTRLVLTGSALRKKYGFSVYTVASYVYDGSRIRDASGLANADVPKQLELIFERDVDGASIAGSFRASIGAGHPAPAFSTELAKLERYFAALGVKQGDHVWLTHIPGVGLGCQVAGNPGLVVPGVAFALAAWGTYFGPINLGVALRDGLTSRLR